MYDMNDFYMRPDCQTKIHINGYVFTIAELYGLAVDALTSEELQAHKEDNK